MSPYEQGQKAFEAGVLWEENPYGDNFESWCNWSDGWSKAQLEQEQERRGKKFKTRTCVVK